MPRKKANFFSPSAKNYLDLRFEIFSTLLSNVSNYSEQDRLIWILSYPRQNNFMF